MNSGKTSMISNIAHAKNVMTIDDSLVLDSTAKK